MTIESPVNFIDDLDPVNPAGGDPKSEGDDHIRNIKTALTASFANVDGAVTADAAAFNAAMPATTAAETAGSATVVNQGYPPGDVRRYGTNTTPGTTDMSTALQAAINQCEQGGAPVVLQNETYAFGTTLTYADGVHIRGVSGETCILSYTGAAAAFESKTPASRVYRLICNDFNLSDAGTGTIGFDCANLSLASFTNITVLSFATGWEFSSPANSTVYNRFINCMATSCGIGVDIQGQSGNSNSFIASRFNSCTTGLRIYNSNQNNIVSCQFEGNTTGLLLDNDGAAKNYRTSIAFSRFETNTEDWNITALCNDTIFVANHYVDGDFLYTDAGTRTQRLEMQGDASSLNLHTAIAGNDGEAWKFTRDGNSATGQSAGMLIEDTSTGSGDPITLQVETPRGSLASGARAFTTTRSTTEQFGIGPAGQIVTNQYSVTGAASSAIGTMPVYDTAGALIGYIQVYAGP